MITPMLNLLHCCCHVLFVMFLAPSYATYFCSYSPVIVHTTQCQIMYHLDCKCHLLENKMDECNICLKKFQSHSKKVTCCISTNGWHMKCITLCLDYTQKLTEEMNNWYCPTCLSYLFPYNLITGDNDFISAIADIFGESDTSFCYLSEKLFMPFEFNDKDHRSAICDIDPDLNFFIKNSTKPPKM